MTVTKKRRTIVFCLLTAVGVFGAVMVSGCGRAGGGGTPVPVTPPAVSSTSPADGATGVSVSANVTAVFSKDMDQSTVTSSTFTLKLKSGGAALSSEVTYNASAKTATLDPGPTLEYNATYEATISTAVKDAAGNALASAKTWVFTTAAQGEPPKTLSPAIGPATLVHEANSIEVTITEAESGSTIYYTLDGSTPTSSSTLYTAPFTIDASKTVKAIAIKAGQTASDVSSKAYDLYWWQPLGGGPGTVDNFTAICSDASGNIYAGALNTAYPYRNFFKWDGNAWGNETSFNSIVRALAAGSGNVVYCGGDFDAITFEDEELLLSRVVKWTGTTWESLGMGVDVSAYALLISGGDLFAAGDFANAGGGPASNIAKWNGTSWSALGGGLDGYAYSLAADESGNIYAGGGFTQAGGSPASKIAKWDGSSWSALGAGTNGNVNALAAGEGGVLYAGGHFSSPGDHIAKWNGTSWSALPGSMSDDADSVNALIVDPSGNLYVGGSFTSAAGVTVNNIAKWNGTSWSAIGGGVNGNVNTLHIDSSGNIYAGGDFTQAGGITVNKIAKWGKK